MTNTESMQATDDSWNSRSWKDFEDLHDADVTVYWPGGQDDPTRGAHDHQAEAERFCTAFPDNRVHNRPYQELFGDGDMTTFVTRFTGTFTGPWDLGDGTVLQPTGKSFDLLYSTTAKWREGRIVEEYLFFDNAELMKQVGMA